jgi:DNA-binding SARP family transcriptional activator
MGATWHLHRLLLLRLQMQQGASVDAGDLPTAQPSTLLHELLTGVVRMHHESLLLIHERAAGTIALATAFCLDIKRKDSAELLLRLGEDAIPELTRGLEDPDRKTRKACADIIARIGGDEARRVLGPLKNPTTEVGRIAIRAHIDSMRRPAPPLRICALGPLRVSIGDRIVSQGDWPSTPALRVFLFLLVRRFRAVERDTILETLWPDEPVTPARHGFSQAIHILRRVLEPDLSPHQPSSYLRASTEEVRLDPGDGSTYDVVQLEEGLGSTTPPAFPGKKTAVTIERLQRTLALYHDDVAEALPDEKCLVDERRKLRNMWLRGASRLLAILAARRAWAEMIPLAEIAVTRDPSKEKFHHHLITAYHESGNRSAAIRAHKRYEKIVYADPLASLSPQIRELFDRIRAS